MSKASGLSIEVKVMGKFSLYYLDVTEQELEQVIAVLSKKHVTHTEYTQP